MWFLGSTRGFQQFMRGYEFIRRFPGLMMVFQVFLGGSWVFIWVLKYSGFDWDISLAANGLVLMHDSLYRWPPTASFQPRNCQWRSSTLMMTSLQISLRWHRSWQILTPAEGEDRSTTGWLKHPVCSTEWPRSVSVYLYRVVDLLKQDTINHVAMNYKLDFSSFFSVLHSLVKSIVHPGFSFFLFPFFPSIFYSFVHSFICSPRKYGEASEVWNSHRHTLWWLHGWTWHHMRNKHQPQGLQTR